MRELFEGTPFVASDCIRIVHNGGAMPVIPGNDDGGTPGWGSPGQ